MSGVPWNAIRIVLQVIGTLALLAAIGLVSTGVLTTSWQTFTDANINEIHQHGLWLDYTYAKQHSGVSKDPVWTSKFKFGEHVKGDHDHEAQPYQLNCLILCCVGVVLGLVGLFMSFCAPCLLCSSIGWALSTLFATILTAAGVIVFYLTASLPENRYVKLSAQNEVIIGYSFLLAVIGAGAFAVATLFAVFCVILTCVVARRGKEPAKTYPKINHAHNTVV